MSRRRGSSNGSAVLIVIAILFGISIIVSIVETLVKFVEHNYIWIISIIAFFVIIKIIIAVNRKIKMNNQIKQYESTPYFKETSLPYDVVIKNKGLEFEMYIFNELNSIFPDSLLITNLLIPRLGSINEYSEIDLIFLHKTGLYVLELKNFSWYIFGNFDNENWSVGYNANGVREVYDFLNPIKQNEQHIKDLNKHLNEDFINYIIFSKDTEIDSNISNVSYFEGFLELVKLRSDLYTSQDLQEIYNKIKVINVYEKLDKHIERIKFNEKKYSKYQKRYNDPKLESKKIRKS